MARGTPSMLALLGLLAVAGYQNRDKIKEMLGNANRRTGPDGGAAGGSILDNLGGMLGGAGAGGVLSGGLGGLIDRFKQAGQGETADSWVKTGPNQPVSPNQLEQALGEDDLRELSEKTGLSREELLTRLSRTLPEAVDQYTPDGRLPSAG